MLPPNELRPREVEILKLVSKGNSYKQIARDLDLSVPTIKVYMGRAKERLAAKSVGHAVALFIELVVG